MKIKLLYFQQAGLVVKLFAENDHDIANFLLDLEVGKVSKVDDLLDAILIEHIWFWNQLNHFVDYLEGLEHYSLVNILLIVVDSAWLSKSYQLHFLFLEMIDKIGLIKGVFLAKLDQDLR